MPPSRLYQRFVFQRFLILWPAGAHVRNHYIFSRNFATQNVRVLEVSPRDGLQNIKQHVPTVTKLELIRRLVDTGLQNIEVTSFASSKWIPQLADGSQVFSEVLRMTQGLNLSLPTLVPNTKGLQSALAVGAREIVVFVSASEAFSRRNTNCSIEEGLARAEEVTKAALAQNLRVRGVVSCVVACPYEGPTKPSKVLELVKRFFGMGCYEVGLGETIGSGTPVDIEKLLKVLLTEVAPENLSGHFHDTYGQAIANVVKAYDMGIRAFDSSVAGLGGCPYAEGAKGNLASEDLIYTMERAGIRTGVNLEKLAGVGDWIARAINVSNNSRAGSAIVARRLATQAVPVKSHNDLSACHRYWKVMRDNGDYKVSQSGTAVKITLTRLKNGNALTTPMVDGITVLFKELARNRSIFHIVLEAEGKYFCTGMDLSSGGSSASDNAREKADYYKKVKDLFTAIEDAPQTTIAAVNGPCFGGGVGLVFVCDLRLLSSKATFTMTEIRLGLTPAIISRFLVREWGSSFLREAMLTGREVQGSELLRIGAVHAIDDELEQVISDRLTKLARCAPKSAGNCKELIQTAYSDPAGPATEEMIRNVFMKMMMPGSEGEYGLARYRDKKKDAIDWKAFWIGQNIDKSQL